VYPFGTMPKGHLVVGVLLTCERTRTEDRRPLHSHIINRDSESRERVTDIVVRELKRAKPGAWGYIQTHEVWSTEEEDNMWSGHFLLTSWSGGGMSDKLVVLAFLS
jgi:hypothetical protein